MQPARKIGARAEAGVTDPLGLSKLLHCLLEVAEGALHQALVLLEVVQQHVPQRLFCQHLGVAQDDYAILGPGQGYIQTPRVTQESNPLQKGCIHVTDRVETGKQDIAHRQ